MVEKTIQQFQDNLEIEEQGQSIELPKPNNMNNGIEVIPEEDGGVTLDFDPSQPEGIQNDFNANISEFLDDSLLTKISTDLQDNYEDDKSSRSDWEDSYKNGLDLLGFKYEERAKPFAGASGVTHPLLSEAVTQFQAQAYKELLPAGGPVRTQVMGDPTPEIEAQSERIKNFMNYQITNVMQEFDPELDQMLFHLPLAGSAFKKIYYDGTLERAVSKFIPAEDLVVPYLISDLESCMRITHVVKMKNNDLRKNQVSGFYRDIDVSSSRTSVSEIKEKQDEISGVEQVSFSEEEHNLLEMHVDLDIPGFEDKDAENNNTGIMLPYIVTVDQDSGEVLSIYRNWNQGDPLRKKKQYFTHYKFLPGLGFYGFGLIHMLGGLSRTATAALRQLIDAGTLSNLPGGFKARGLRVRDDDEAISPGEWRDVDAPGGNLRDSLMPLPYKEPSGTLFQLLGFVTEAGRRFAGVTDMMMGEGGSQQQPVGTTMAILERGMKVMSAIHKRLHYAQKVEFNLLSKVFSEYLPPEYPYMVAGGNQTVKQTDFDDRVDVIPVSDPNIFSMAQRVTLAQTQLQLAQSKPEMHNLHEAYRRMYAALGVQNIEKVLPPPPQPQPKDPAMENAGALAAQKPVAFPEQDHSAHIRGHRAFMSSSLVRQQPPIMAMLQAHITEHVGFMARNIVQEEMGPEIEQIMQETGGQIPPEMQQQIESRTESAVAVKIAEIIEQMVAEEQEMFDQTGSDPLVQLKQQEIDLKKNDLELKAMQQGEKQALDEKKLQQKDTIDRERMQSQEDIAQLKANVALDKAEGDRNMDRSERAQDRLLKKEQQRENVAIKQSQINKDRI
tara:strand:+ start:1888 stop:4392 length:2505 start_codon:yes stop_codon:yes gene_type:complete